MEVSFFESLIMPHAPLPMTPIQFELKPIYKLNAVSSPQSCGHLAKKVTNIRAKIKSIEDIAADRLARNSKISGLNKALLIAGVVQDTCVAFLDLAAALVPDERVQRVAKAGVWSISTAETASQLAYGQTDMVSASHKTIDSTIGALSPKTTIGKTTQHIAQSHSAIAGVAITDLKGGDTKSEAKKMMINTAFDKVQFMLDVGNTTDNTIAKKVGSGLGLAKAALNYRMALEKRSKDYWDEQTDLVVDEAETKTRNTIAVRRITTDLNAAIAEFDACVASQ